MPFCEQFENVLNDCGLSEYSEYSKEFKALAAHLVLANEKYNLTAITDDESIIKRHFADSLTSCKYIPENASVVDIGTGGGFPALPLAIVRGDLSITALDSTSKKLGFINEVKDILSLSNIKTLSARAEEVGTNTQRERFDVAISRAVARLNILCELCLPLIKVGGLFIAMKGQDGEAELSEAQRGIKILGGEVSKVNTFTLSDCGSRSIIVIRKISETPSKYPRTFAKIKKSPL